MNLEVSASFTAPSTCPRPSSAIAHTSQPPIKPEDDEDDFLLDEDAHQDAVYKSRAQLPQPGTFLRTLDYLMRALDAGDIDINPEYQREVVWTGKLSLRRGRSTPLTSCSRSHDGTSELSPRCESYMDLLIQTKLT
jgi:hypothetical protein